MSDSDSSDAFCVYCSDLVDYGQHAVSCDGCESWTHLWCNTGVSESEYKKAERGQIELTFKCHTCLSATVNTSSVADSTPPGDFNLDFSISTDASAVAANLNATYTVTSTSAEPANDSEPFDITHHNLVNVTTHAEQPLHQVDQDGDRIMSDSVLETSPEVQYTVIEEGTRKKRQKLVSSDGFAYNIKKKTKRSVYDNMDYKIGLLWDEYDAHDIVCEEFLSRVGEIYGRTM